MQPLIVLTTQQKRELKTLIKENPSPWQVAKRLEALRLLDTGLPVSTVSQQLCINTEIIYKYIKAFKEKGFMGLIQLEKPGRESKLSEENILEVEKYIEDCRKKGIKCTLVDQVAFVKNKFAIEIGAKWLYKRLLLRKHRRFDQAIPTLNIS